MSEVDSLSSASTSSSRTSSDEDEMTLETRCAQGGLDPISRRTWSSVDVQHSGSEEALVQALQRCRRALHSLSYDATSFVWSAAAFASACARCADVQEAQ